MEARNLFTEFPVKPGQQITLSDGHDDLVDRIRIVTDTGTKTSFFEYHLVKKDLWIRGQEKESESD